MFADEADQYVVRAGLARPDSLIAGTTVHRLIPGLTGSSVQSAPVEALARGGQFRNRQISVTTRRALQQYGFDLVFPTTGRGAYHATVRAPDPLPPDRAPTRIRFREEDSADGPHLFRRKRGRRARTLRSRDSGISSGPRAAVGQTRGGRSCHAVDGQEIEVEAVLEFDRSSNRWMALPLWDTIRRRDEKHKWPDVAE
jgi:hypothetical protein